MRKNFLFFIIILGLLQAPASNAMEIEPDSEKIHSYQKKEMEKKHTIEDDIKKEPVKSTGINLEEEKHSNIPSKENDCCSHWGLYHWFSGIGEYIQRCFCCKIDKKNGRYIKHYRRDDHKTEYKLITSDCSCDDYSACNDLCGERDHCCTPLVCSPCAALEHCCCLPCACFECSGEQTNKYYYDRPSSIHYYPPITHNKPMSDEEIRRMHAARSDPQNIAYSGESGR